MEAITDIVVPIITVIAIPFNHSAPAISLSLASNIPSIGGHSISAITPDFKIVLGGLATV